jgi:hypothetical protein
MVFDVLDLNRLDTFFPINSFRILFQTYMRAHGSVFYFRDDKFKSHHVLTPAFERFTSVFKIIAKL